jgi:hypothetical protein
MSMLMPVHPEQVERWRRPRPEPVALALPKPWVLEQVVEPDDTFPNQRSLRWRSGAARIELLRYWDTPRNPGYPMAAASRRAIVVAGRNVELITTSMWEGVQGRAVEVCWITGAGHDVKYGVRVVFEDCTLAQITEALAHVTIDW